MEPERFESDGLEPERLAPDLVVSGGRESDAVETGEVKLSAWVVFCSWNAIAQGAPRTRAMSDAAVIIHRFPNVLIFTGSMQSADVT